MVLNKSDINHACCSYNEVKQVMLERSNGAEVLGPGKHMSAAACAGTAMFVSVYCFNSYCLICLKNT